MPNYDVYIYRTLPELHRRLLAVKMSDWLTWLVSSVLERISVSYCLVNINMLVHYISNPVRLSGEVD